MPPPLLALTMGEPSGIGPDITIMAWRKLRNDTAFTFFVIGNARLLEERTELLELDCPCQVIATPDEAQNVFATALPILPIDLAAPCVAGEISSENSPAIISAIEQAVTLVLAGNAAAIVTNPIHKDALYQAGFRHHGHTEFLADLARQAGHNAQPVMMLSTGSLRTIPLTIHIPLKDVPSTITRDNIISQVSTTARDLTRYFAIDPPRIAITGLNPHAGENGAMGREEIDVIIPAINALQEAGLNVSGPLPADTVFHDEARAGFDVICCMYHDQALIPVKTLGFHDGVNTTLGLPFIRTSPDHGTALTLAGRGTANPSSLIAALQSAAAACGVVKNEC